MCLTLACERSQTVKGAKEIISLPVGETALAQIKRVQAWYGSSRNPEKPDFGMRCQFWCQLVLGFGVLCCVTVQAPGWLCPDYGARPFSLHTAKKELPRGSIFEIDVAAFHSSGE